eukprot:jgi/Tetstr1/461869/TSEL_006948.t1
MREFYPPVDHNTLVPSQQHFLLSERYRSALPQTPTNSPHRRTVRPMTEARHRHKAPDAAQARSPQADKASAPARQARRGVPHGERSEQRAGRRDSKEMGVSEAWLQNLLREMEASQGEIELTQESAAEASIDGIVPPAAPPSKADEDLAAELERAAWVLRSNEVQLADALREVDSLDKVLAWARRNQRGEHGRQPNGQPVLAELMAMIEAQQRRPDTCEERTTAVQKLPESSKRTQASEDSAAVAELKAALREAQESASRKETALSAALAQAEAQVAGLCQGGERLAVSLGAADGEVARLRSELATREAHIAEIRDLLAEAVSHPQQGRRSSSSEGRDRPPSDSRRRTLDHPSPASSQPRPPRHPAPFEHLQYQAPPARRRRSSATRGRHSEGGGSLASSSQESNNTPSVVSWLLASEVDTVVSAEPDSVRRPDSKRGTNEWNDTASTHPQSPRQQTLHREQPRGMSGYVARISQSARERAGGRAPSAGGSPRHRSPAATTSPARHLTNSNHRAAAQKATNSTRPQQGNAGSSQRRATWSDALASQPQRSPRHYAPRATSPLPAPLAWRAPGGEDINASMPADAAGRKTGTPRSKPPSGISYIDMVKELANAFGDPDSEAPTSPALAARRKDRPETTTGTAPKVGALTLESMFHLGNARIGRGGDDVLTTTPKNAAEVLPRMPRPGNSYAEIFVVKREAQARLAALHTEHEYGTGRHLQHRRKKQSASRSNNPGKSRRHTTTVHSAVASAASSPRPMAGNRYATADDVVSTAVAPVLNTFVQDDAEIMAAGTVDHAASAAERQPVFSPSAGSALILMEGYSSDAPTAAGPTTPPAFLRASVPTEQPAHRRRSSASIHPAPESADSACAGLLFAGNVWYGAVADAAAAEHPSPGGPAVSLLARWGAVDGFSPSIALDKDDTMTPIDDIAKPPTRAANNGSPAEETRTAAVMAASHRRCTSACAALTHRRSSSGTEAAGQDHLLTSDAAGTMDHLYHLIGSMSQAPPYSTSAASSRRPSDECGGEEGRAASPRVMLSGGGSVCFYYGEDGALHPSPRSTLDDVALSPRGLRSPRALPSAAERTWRPQLQGAGSRDPQRSHPSPGAEHPLAGRFAQWKHACGWSNLAAVVLYEVKRARQEIARISKAELAALRSFTRPPPAVQRTLEALAIILSDGQLPQRWVNVLSLLRSESLKAELLAFAPQELPPRAVHLLQTSYLNHPHFTFVEVARANRALGPLLRWIKAIVSYGAYRHLWFGRMDCSTSSAAGDASLLYSSAEASDAGEAAASAAVDGDREEQLDRWRRALAAQPPLLSPRTPRSQPPRYPVSVGSRQPLASH